MTDIDKAEVYRKAAEIIVRDGKHRTTFVEGWSPHPEAKNMTDLAESIRDRQRPVCAIGACLRAEFELTGGLKAYGNAEYVYDEYTFTVPYDGYAQDIWMFNDHQEISAEDVALELKKHAEAIDVDPRP